MKNFTLEWVDSDLLPQDECCLYLFPLDALDPKAWEIDRHCSWVDLKGAHAFLAPFLANQTVRMGTVRSVYRHA